MSERPSPVTEAETPPWQEASRVAVCSGFPRSNRVSGWICHPVKHHVVTPETSRRGTSIEQCLGSVGFVLAFF